MSMNPQDIHGWSMDRVQELQKAVALTLGKSLVFRDPLQSGGEGPEMVVIPHGKYLMGSPENEPGREEIETQHPVTIENPLAFGRYAVTLAEFDAFCEATNREKPGDRDWGRGNLPAINISWEDAKAYCQWLSRESGHFYRLPSEEEWEYACRAGTTGPFNFDLPITTDKANYDGKHLYAGSSPSPYRAKTVPVGSFAPNPWGLYEMHGNVWEWCEDAWQVDDSTDNSIIDVGKNENHRVLRGGFFNAKPQYLRSAYRFWYTSGLRDLNHGFRLVRTLIE